MHTFTSLVGLVESFQLSMTSLVNLWLIIVQRDFSNVPHIEFYLISHPDAYGAARTVDADRVGAAGGRPAQRGVTGHAPPALVTPALSVHAVPVIAAALRLATPLVDAQDCGHGSGTAPPAVLFAEEAKR